MSIYSSRCCLKTLGNFPHQRSRNTINFASSWSVCICQDQIWLAWSISSRGCTRSYGRGESTVTESCRRGGRVYTYNTNYTEATTTTHHPTTSHSYHKHMIQQDLRKRQYLSIFISQRHEIYFCTSYTGKIRTILLLSCGILIVQYCFND